MKKEVLRKHILNFKTLLALILLACKELWLFVL